MPSCKCPDVPVLTCIVRAQYNCSGVCGVRAGAGPGPHCPTFPITEIPRLRCLCCGLVLTAGHNCRVQTPAAFIDVMSFPRTSPGLCCMFIASIMLHCSLTLHCNYFGRVCMWGQRLRLNCALYTRSPSTDWVCDVDRFYWHLIIWPTVYKPSQPSSARPNWWLAVSCFGIFANYFTLNFEF